MQNYSFKWKKLHILDNHYLTGFENWRKLKFNLFKCEADTLSIMFVLNVLTKGEHVFFQRDVNLELTAAEEIHISEDFIN